MLRKIISRISLTMSVALLSATMLYAVSLPVPSGLKPGDKYQLIFVTNATHDATSSDISVYNSFVNHAANLAGIGTDYGLAWHAIASTASINAINNAPVLAHVYDFNCGSVAANKAQFWNGNPERMISINEFHQQITDCVWTGTDANGYASSNQYLGAARPMYGVTYYDPGPWWVESQGSQWYWNTWNFHLYALSDPITVIPEPSVLTLLAIGTVILSAYVWRRK
jgi:hypothetical protein